MSLEHEKTRLYCKVTQVVKLIYEWNSTETIS